MCGIAGKILLNSGKVETHELKEMSEKIRHRGPDDEGIFISIDKKLGLVNRRLAIIDLTKAGHQPMPYMNRYWITYNGETYNFRKERDNLKRQGYKFVSNSDTEVILALYDKYKERCLRHLRGMFAFAIYDQKENSIFLARDRLGKKPLKYFFENGVFIFASELKAIVTQKEVKLDPDWIAINHYLTLGYTPPPYTGFTKIKKLPPAHYIFLDLKRKSLEMREYWKPDFSEKLSLSEHDWSNLILKELEEATKLRMIADVPIGAFLSGGVDSSAVVAMMAKNSNKPIKTFSIGFKEKKYSELEHARRIAKLYKTEHTELVVEPESIEALPQLVYQYEEPYSDSSAIVTYAVSKLARKYVTVALNGDGGDENFAGYDRYNLIKRDVFLDSIQPLGRPLIGPLVKQISDLTGNKLSKRIHNFLVKSESPLADRFVSYVCIFKEEEKKNLYSRNKNNLLNTRSLVREIFEKYEGVDPRDNALYWDLVRWLPDDLLAKVDIASMAASLEARSPILDHNLVELACKIPFDLKVKGWYENKYIFKKALESLVPNENLYRKKMGFSIPLSEWFSGNLNTYAKKVLLSRKSTTRNFLNSKLIRQMLTRHSEKEDFGPKLWSLLCLELWFREFFN